MNTVDQRELSDDLGEILRRVEAGESVQVIADGRVVAVLVPPAPDVLSQRGRVGEVRRAPREPSTLRDIRRQLTTRSSEQIAADSRGRW